MNRRIFIAIDISDEARRRVADYIGNLRREFPHLRIGWERAEKLHLTLKFLGETNEKQLSELVEIVGKTAAQFSGFELQIAETGIFPLLRKPRILWLGVKDETHSLSKISELLEIKCASIGFTRETRKFKPHLTLARLREPDKSKEIAQKHVENEFEPSRFDVSGIVVYESKLQPSGSIYEAISKFEFAKSKTINQ